MARAALEKQAEDVSVIDLRALSSVTDFFVVCTVLSGRQLSAVAEHIEGACRRAGSRVGHVEGVPAPTASARSGSAEPQWVLIDCGDVVVHVFDQSARAFYRLEQLWADAPRVPLGA